MLSDIRVFIGRVPVVQFIEWFLGECFLLSDILPAPGGGLVMWEGAEFLVVWSFIWSVSDYKIASLADPTPNNKFLGGAKSPPPT